MPHFIKLLFSEEDDIQLTEDERKSFALLEGPPEGPRKIAYLVTTQNISPQMNQRAKSLAIVLKKTHGVRLIVTTRDLLKIVVDNVVSGGKKEAVVAVKDSELYDSLNELFTRAMKANASDIHIEAFEKKTDIKF